MGQGLYFQMLEWTGAITFIMDHSQFLRYPSSLRPERGHLKTDQCLLPLTARAISRPLCTLPFLQHFLKTSTNVQSPVEAVGMERITLDEDRLLTKQFNTDNVRGANGNAGRWVRNRKPISDS